MQRHPGWATYVGDHRWGDKLEDGSAEAEAQAYADRRSQRAQALSLARSGLNATDRTSLDLFVQGIDQSLMFEPLVGYRRMSLGANGGFHTEFADLLQASPVNTAAAVENYLARLAAYPRRLEQELVALRQGLALGWVPPKAVLQRVLTSIDTQLNAALDSGPFLAPLATMGQPGNAIAAPEQAALRERARRLVSEQVLPAQRRLRDFVAG